MTTPVNCPNCGSQLPPGAPSCARCGERFDVEPEVTLEAEAPAPEPPPKLPSATPPPRATTGTGHAASGDAAKAIQEYLADSRARWGLEQTPFLLAVVALTLLAFVIGTIALSLLLTAGSDDIKRQLNNAVWLTTAGAAAFGGLVLAILVRNEATGSPAAPDVNSVDFRAAMVVGGLALLWSLIAVITGMGGHPENGEAWARYSAVFAFITATLLVLAQPVPVMLGTMKTTTIGVIAAGVAAVALFIGTIQGMSDSFDTYIGGLALQQLAINVLILDLGWMLGMQRR
jgi:hypothetical protein